MTPETPTRALPESRRTYWDTAIKEARRRREEIAQRYDWQGNLDRYQPDAPKGESWDVNLGMDFADVERKKAALLFDTPAVSLTDPAPGLEQAVAFHGELLNTILGPEHADVQPTTLKAIFNCLCPAGIGPVIVGYSCTKQVIEQPVPVVDPATGMGIPAIDPATGQPQVDQTGQQVMQTEVQPVPVPIAERWFVSPISPKALLLPAELRDTAYQKTAAWIGYDWQKPLSQVRREYGLPDDWTASGGSLSEKPYFDQGNDLTDRAGDPLVHGTTIWFRAELEPTEDGRTIHPDLVRILTIVDGKSEPLEYRDSPDQTLIAEGPEAGRLSPDSMLDFPIRPLVLRDLSDSAWIPSDCAMTAALTKEQQRYREIALTKRDTNVSVIGYEPSLAEPFETAKKAGLRGGTIHVPVPSGSITGGQLPMVQFPVANQGRETYVDQDLIRMDRGRILGIDDNQAGATAPTKRTATESSIVQRNTDARFEQERQRVLRWFLHDVVRPLDALILRYCDQRMATRILGPQKAQVWWSMKPHLAGGYHYTLQMDSGKYLDVESKRRQTLQVYNLLAKSPYVNQQQLHLLICTDFGFDPATFLSKPEPPKPEPPKVALSFSGQDFAAPQGPVCLAILQQLGVQIDPAAVAAMQQAQMLQMQQQMQQAALGASAQTPMHGGAADKAERIDQHQLGETGQIPGRGIGQGPGVM